jgi:hypothetical protein
VTKVSRSATPFYSLGMTNFDWLKSKNYLILKM